jgi:ribose/xylose/arabinose/galactoside ABC-type transport system permease subunit
MMRGRLPPAVRQRIVFLLAGNVVLLAVIWLLLKEGGSFGSVLRRAGPDLAATLIAGLGLTGIIFTGAIDLSIASIMAVAATVFGILVHRGFSPMACYIACVGTAWGLSVLNGEAVRQLRLPAIIVTLAGLPLYRGVALIVADLGIPQFGGNIFVHNEAYHTPGKLWLGPLLLSVLGLALLWEASARMPRRWLALGSSEEACHLMGLHPGRILQSAFAVGGLFLGLASLIYVTRVQTIEPFRIALGFELQVIGAVVLGGANIFGGEGSYLGSILGALFLYLISQVLTYAGASPYSQDAIAGAVIVFVIGMDCALHRRRKLMEELG